VFLKKLHNEIVSSYREVTKSSDNYAACLEMGMTCTFIVYK